MRKATANIDYTSKDYEAFRSMMLKQLGIKMPEYTDLRQSDAGVVILELLAQGLDIISYYQDTMANEAFLVTAEQRDSLLKWCQMLGYTPRNATPARFNQVFVLSSPQSTDTIIPQGTVVKTYGTSAEPEVLFETERDLKIPAGCLGNEKKSNGDYLYTVSVVQGTSVEGEVLGSSTGAASQKFILNYSPVVVDSVSVFVNEGSGYGQWSRVDNFIDSTTVSRHFTVSVSNNNEATVTFGDGVFGKIPVACEDNIFCCYLVGGGETGNVGKNKIKVLDSNIALVAETFNPDLAYERGQDKETNAEIKRNAPIANRTIWGAITAKDFSDVIKLHFPDVELCTAYYNLDNPDNLDIYVYLKDELELTDEYISRILELFDENAGGRKLVGADELFIYYPEFVPVDFTIDLIVKPRYKREDVEVAIKNYLTYFFRKGNYDFNTDLSISEVATNIMNPKTEIKGIKALKVVSPTDDILTPERGEIYCLGEVVFNTTGGISDEADE